MARTPVLYGQHFYFATENMDVFLSASLMKNLSFADVFISDLLLLKIELATESCVGVAFV